MIERERGADPRPDDEAARVSAPDEADASARGDDAAKAANPASDDAEFRRQMEIARQVMRDHRNVLRALAK